MVATVDATPLITTERKLVLLEAVAEVITEVVEATPLTVVVNILPESEVVRELMMLVKSVETPLTIEAKVLVVVLNVFEFTKLVVVVEIIPFTLEVSIKLLVVVAIDNILVVVAEMRAANEVVDRTPFTFAVNTPVLVA